MRFLRFDEINEIIKKVIAHSCFRGSFRLFKLYIDCSQRNVEIRVFSHVSAMIYAVVGYITPIVWGQRHPPELF